MAEQKFDYQAAMSAGKSEDDILSYLTQAHPKFDINAALSSGKTKVQIIDYLSSVPPDYGQNIALNAAKDTGLSAPLDAGTRFIQGAGAELLGTPNEPLKKGVLPEMPSTNNPASFAAQMLVRPSVENIYGQAASGNLAGAAGAATADVVTLGGAALADKFLNKIGPLVKNVTNSVEKRALGWAEQRGIPMTAGQKTGQRGLQQFEAGLEHFPGSSAAAREFYDKTAEAIAQTGRDLAAVPTNIVTSPYGTSKNIEFNLSKIVNNTKSKADTLYDRVRKQTSANTVTMQTGTKTLPIVSPNGQPLTVAINSVFETPVSLDPIRQQLAPIYDDLMRSMPEARRVNSPAFRALQDLMTSKEPFQNAMDFDRFLSAMKALTRDGRSELLSTKSQGLAKKVIVEGEAEFQKALATAGPGVANDLKRAREFVRKYHEVDEFRLDLGEPGGIYDRIIHGGNYTVDTLKELRRLTPGDVKVMARTFLEGLVEKATKEGGFSRSAGIMADWSRIPDETKNLLFGPQLTSDLDNFLIAAKKLQHPEGSRTAPMMAALGTYGAPLIAMEELVRGTMQGEPGKGAMNAGAAMGTAYFAPKIMSKILFNSRGIKFLTEAFATPKYNLASAAAMKGLKNMWDMFSREETVQISQDNSSLKEPSKVDEIPSPASGIERNRTKLPSQDSENAFQQWYRYWAAKMGLDMNPDGPFQLYDYRGAFAAGLEPQISREDGQLHWPGEFKDPDHPTQWKNYAPDPSNPEVGIGPDIPNKRREGLRKIAAR